MNCLSTDDFRIKALEKETNIPAPLLIAKVAVWQENNGNTNTFPKAEDLVGKIINIYYKGNTTDNKSLSNLAERPFTHNEKRYFSVEHAYQSLKSGKFDLITYNKYKSGGIKIAGNLGTKTQDNYNLSLMKTLIKESLEQNPEIKQELLDTNNAVLTHFQDSGIWKTKFPELLMEVRNELGGKSIVQTTQSADKLIQSRIVDEYFFYKNASDTLSNIQGLLQLIKGFKGTFAEAENFITLLNKLGYSINDDFTDIVKNDLKTDLFAKNYEKTQSTITTTLKEAGVLHPDGFGINVILNDKFLKQSIVTAIDLMKISKLFFVSQTSLAKSIRDNVFSLFKPYKVGKTDFVNNFRKNFLSYATVTAYMNSVKNDDDLKLPHIKDFLLAPLNEVAEGKEYNDLQSTFLQILSYNRENKINNEFLNFLEIDHIDYDKHKSSLLYGHRLYTFVANSRSLKDPNKIQELISGFNQLYFANNDNIIEKDDEKKRINNLKHKFAKDMFKYLIVKDGLLYQNQSFIKAIDPILFADTSKQLDEIQDLFKKENPSPSEFIKIFGMTKEEMELDFVMKFGLHADNYFDLNSQRLDVILTNREQREKKIAEEKENESKSNEVEKLENLGEGNEEDVDSEELIEEDKHPLYWNNADKSLTINQFAEITSDMYPRSSDNDNVRRTKKEKLKQSLSDNKRYILAKENEIFKTIKEPFVTPDGKDKTYDVIGLPLITYVNTKDGNSTTRIPLKLSLIQNTVEINKQFITLQFSPEGKVIRTDKKNLDKLSSLGVMFTDLQENSIFEIINNSSSLKLKTSKDNIPNLIKIAKELSGFYRGGFIVGTRAKYSETVTYGTSKLSSYGDDLKSQEQIKMSEEEQKKVTMSMYNRKDNTITEDKKRDILLTEINKYSANPIEKKNIEKIETPDLETILKNYIKASNNSLTEKQIEDKIKECFKTK